MNFMRKITIIGMSICLTMHIQKSVASQSTIYNTTPFTLQVQACDNAEYTNCWAGTLAKNSKTAFSGNKKYWRFLMLEFPGPMAQFEVKNQGNDLKVDPANGGQLLEAPRGTQVQGLNWTPATKIIAGKLINNTQYNLVINFCDAANASLSGCRQFFVATGSTVSYIASASTNYLRFTQSPLPQGALGGASDGFAIPSSANIRFEKVGNYGTTFSYATNGNTQWTKSNISLNPYGAKPDYCNLKRDGEHCQYDRECIISCDTDTQFGWQQKCVGGNSNCDRWQ